MKLPTACSIRVCLYCRTPTASRCRRTSWCSTSRLRQAGGAPGGAAFEESERLAQLPEVREKISEMMAAHWEHWVNQPLPILGNRTPMDAVKDPDGREIVESLVLQGERLGRSPNLQTDENVFRRLRGRLGLAGGRSTKSASTIG
jgi:uncharacterized protein (DUF2384 family)